MAVKSNYQDLRGYPFRLELVPLKLLVPVHGIGIILAEEIIQWNFLKKWVNLN